MSAAWEAMRSGAPHQPYDPISKRGARVAARCSGAITRKSRPATAPRNRRYSPNFSANCRKASTSPRRFTATTAAASALAAISTPTAAVPSWMAARFTLATTSCSRRTSRSTPSATRCIPHCAARVGSKPRRLPSKTTSGSAAASSSCPA